MGKLVLFCVAVSVLCSLLTADDIPVDPKFDPTKLSGKWYPILTSSFTGTPPKTLFALKTKPLSGGGFSAVFEIPKDGTCQELKYNLKPISPGSFQTEDGNAKFQVLKTDYTSFVFCVYETESERILQLLANKLEITPRWKTKFQHFAKRLGVKSEVKDISHTALCTSPPKRK